MLPYPIDPWGKVWRGDLALLCTEGPGPEKQTFKPQNILRKNRQFSRLVKPKQGERGQRDNKEHLNVKDIFKLGNGYLKIVFIRLVGKSALTARFLGQ